jgi:hypothetical protein
VMQLQKRSVGRSAAEAMRGSLVVCWRVANTVWRLDWMGVDGERDPIGDGICLGVRVIGLQRFNALWGGL